MPMHALDNPESIAYILRDSAAVLLFVDSVERWRAIWRPATSAVSSGGGPDGCGAGRRGGGQTLVALDRWLDGTDGAMGAPRPPQIDPDDLAAVVYTSGTTGRPKGVMLSHANILANVKAIAERLEAESTDVFLSFLPLSHTLERTCGYYFPSPPGPRSCSRARPSSSPTISRRRAPRSWSRCRGLRALLRAIMERRAALGPARARPFDLAVAVGLRRYEARRRGRAPFASTGSSGRRSTAPSPRRSAPSSAAACESRSPAARRSGSRSSACSWAWGSTSCKATG